jgi:peptide deformylase
MALRPIITAPDPRLKIVSKKVERVTAETRRLMDDLLETMYAAPGIGLAAIQIGEPQRIIVLDIARQGEEKSPRFFVNPIVTWTSEEMATYEEGCLSVPDLYDDVERPARCRVEYLDYDGKPQVLEAEGLLATCVQHEIDHLEGVLFIDHLSKLKRDILLRKLIKAKRRQATEAAE